MRALAHRGVECFGWNRSADVVGRATRDGFDASLDLKAVLERAQEHGSLIIIAVPMFAVRDMLSAIKEWAPDCPFTDVVSVKAEVLDEVRSYGLHRYYVGSHPMAGTAESGWKATDRRLFEGAPWVVSIDPGVDPAVWCLVARVAEDCGAEIVPATSAKHDDAAARISHLPHLLAESLAIVADEGGMLPLSLAAGSFKDGTRVAKTHPDLVRTFCESNRESVVNALDSVLDLLHQARESLAAGDTIEHLTERGWTSRRRFDARRGSRPVFVITPGKPGWLDELARASDLGARVYVRMPF